MSRRKPLVVLRETDVEKGGLTLSTALEELELALETQVIAEEEEHAARHVLMGGVEVVDYQREKHFKYCRRASRLRTALLAAPPPPWSRPACLEAAVLPY